MELKRIRILPDDVVSQIAAGEVVERPASVIKELVENALDAGATDISIEVEGAGKRLIAVADNGQGIAPDELELAITRHATSKLSSAQDLFSIHTLGFRGEALASMASVSRLTITSRRPEELTGAYVRVEGGQVREIERYGGPAGTEVRVEDLFYNVPARLKFLKKDTTERQQMIALVTRYAMAYPETRFKLIMEGTRALQTSGRGDRREVLAQLYGVDVAKQMLEVQLVDGERRVQGFISPVALTRSNRKEITLFVNGRWVQDAALVTAVLRAYHTLIMVGRYPLVVLFVDLPPQEVDVNVHPAKAEVRFRDPDQVFSMVQRAVKRALLAYSPVPQVTRSFWPASSAYQGWSEP
ncbi:MAG TPA: DNA mismatch repair endonuclease MutL, partial [Anaerolineaceae bacterium]|nr:DNA mismatch repair endonuclease MutL [Anaerolineaceae bacterium]